MDNADFIAQHAAPGRIGLCGGRDMVNKLIRKAQAPLTNDGHRSLWAHAFVFNERRADGQWWVIESDLDIRFKHVRLGVQENRASRYFDEEAFPNLAILDFHLDAAQTRQVQVAALDLLAGQCTYSLRELAGSMLAMYSTRLRRRENVLAREGSLYCSAMVAHCYAAAGIQFHRDMAGKNVAPHHLDQSLVPHDTHRLIRDPGISSFRRLSRAARAAMTWEMDG